MSNSFATRWTVAPGPSVHGKNTGVDSHFLLQEIFPTQGSNPHLLHGRQILHHWATREAHCHFGESYSIHVCLKILCIQQAVITKFLSCMRLETTVPRGEWSGAAHREKDQSQLPSLLLVDGINSHRTHKPELLTQNLSIMSRIYRDNSYFSCTQRSILFNKQIKLRFYCW